MKASNIIFSVVVAGVAVALGIGIVTHWPQDQDRPDTAGQAFTAAGAL